MGANLADVLRAIQYELGAAVREHSDDQARDRAGISTKPLRCVVERGERQPPKPCVAREVLGVTTQTSPIPTSALVRLLIEMLTGFVFSPPIYFQLVDRFRVKEVDCAHLTESRPKSTPHLRYVVDFEFDGRQAALGSKAAVSRCRHLR